MGWTAIADGFDAFSAAVINEYVGALNERRQALGQATIGVYAEDDLVPNSQTILRAWQQWVETYLTSFVVSHDGVAGVSVPRAAGHYDGATTIDTYANLAAVFDAAGIVGYTNWRRFRDDAFFAYGKATEDDDYDIGIFEDLQKVLAALVWVDGSGVFDVSSKEEASTRYELAAWQPTRAAAEANTEAVYDAATPIEIADNPSASSAMFTGWVGRLIRRYGYCVGSPPAPCSRAVDFYAYSSVPDGVLSHWEPNGDWPVGYVVGNLYYYDTQGPTADAAISSVKFGHNDPGPGNRPAWGANADEYYGWELDEFRAVVRWNVVGGFTYQ